MLQSVLIGEEPVVGAEATSGRRSGLGQENRADLPRQHCGNGILEEEPDVSSLSGSRTVDGRFEIVFTARLHRRRHFLLAPSLSKSSEVSSCSIG